MERLAREDCAGVASSGYAVEPEVVNRPALRRAHRGLRVAALNARGGGSFAGIVACLKRPPLNEADLILLCEADVGMKRSRHRAVAAEIAALFGMSYAYAPEWYVAGESGRLIRHVGSAILSAAPFDDIAAVPMPHTRIPSILWQKRDRHEWTGAPAGLISSVRFGGRPLAVGVAHLHSRCGPAHRERQMAAYLAGFPASGPAIVGGDLNTTTTELSSLGKFFRTFGKIVTNPGRFRDPIPHEPLFARLLESGFSLEGANVPGRGTFTYHGAIPRRFRPKLDWLAIRGLSPVPGSAAVISPRAALFSPRASDHDFVTADIEW
ncbi:MAG: endonuclease/exonuclease/phosphatase family protein [Candidatus Binataceae bacterium]